MEHLDGALAGDLQPFRAWFETHAHVYAYGAGRYGKALVGFLTACGLQLDGVLVTDKNKNPETCEGIGVFQADETNLTGCGVILAISEKYRSGVRAALASTGIDHLEIPDEMLRQMGGWAWNVKHFAWLSAMWPKKHQDGHLRVAIFSHCTPLMGACRSLLDNLSVWKTRTAFHPVVITPDAGELNQTLLDMGIPSIACDFDWWAHVPPQKARDNTQAVKALTGVLSKLGMDLCYSNGSVIDIGARVAENLHVPHVWHIREYAAEDYGLSFDIGYEEAKRVIQRISAAVIFISKALAAKYVAVTGASENYHLIYNGVSLRQASMKTRADFERTPLAVVMVGGVNAAKNQRELLEAFACLSPEERTNFELHFYGPEEPAYRRDLDAVIAQHDMSDHVHFHGYTSDVGGALAACEIGVMASRSEAFGRVTAEYMMSGLFPIASDTGANPELLREGKDGILYPLGDTEALAGSLRWCLSHRDEMADVAMRNQGRATEDRFSPKRTADAIYGIFEETVNAQMSSGGGTKLHEVIADERAKWCLNDGRDAAYRAEAA